MVLIDQANLCLHELFEQRALQSPQAPAVVDSRVSLTYEELDRQAELLAGYLRERGIGPDKVVAVYLDKCVEYVVACLASMKAGGAFLPLEMAYPRSMVEEVLADSKPRVVLTRRPPRREPSRTSATVLYGRRLGRRPGVWRKFRAETWPG